jgi:predicted nucleotidyltransferase
MEQGAAAMPVDTVTHSTDEILGLLRRHRADLQARYDVQALGLFGSHVRGEASPSSDVDLLVEFWRPPTLFQFVRLQLHLSELLGVPVDLVMKSALKPAIGQVILSEVVPV